MPTLITVTIPPVTTAFLAMLALLTPSSGLAKPPLGLQVDPELHAWFERQHSVTGAWCCDISDGQMLADDEWRVVGEHYEVRILGMWLGVGPSQLRDPAGGPNPTEHAVVWYTTTEYGVRIYCFAPGRFY